MAAVVERNSMNCVPRYEGRIPRGRLRVVSAGVDAGATSLDVSSLVLVAVLLAAGAILKLTLGSVLTFAGTKPNFIIAMYCLAILLVRAKPGQALVIGLLAGCICQIPMMNATPWLNIPSEVLGAFVMALVALLPLKVGKLDPVAPLGAFLATVVSGYTFVILLALVNGMALLPAVVTYVPMVFGTAFFNTVLVTVLVIPLRKVLKR